MAGVRLGCSRCAARTPPLKGCARCRAVHYCDARCQRLDWSAHKLECHQLEADASGTAVLRVAMEVPAADAFATIKDELERLLRGLDVRVDLTLTDSGDLSRRDAVSSHRQRVGRLAAAQQLARELALRALELGGESEVVAAEMYTTVLTGYARETARLHAVAAPELCVGVAERILSRLQQLWGGEAPVAAEAELQATLGTIRARLGEPSAARCHLRRALTLRTTPTGASAHASTSSTSSTSLPLTALHRELVAIEAASGELQEMEAQHALALEAAADPPEQRRLRLQLAQCYHHIMHESRMECAAVCADAPALRPTDGREAIADDVWDSLVELERKARVCRHRASSAYQQLVHDAVEADDVRLWSCAVALHSHFLLNSAEPGSDQAALARRRAGAVLRVHACDGRCPAATVAAAVAAADGPLPTDMLSLLGDGSDKSNSWHCDALDASAWEGQVREKERLTRELTDAWPPQG